MRTDAILALSGFMGSGKSTVAAILAKRFACGVLDLDDCISGGEKLSIGRIFAERGEAGFRRLEYHYLSKIIRSHSDSSDRMILALGGGTLTTEACASLVKENCTCVYLRASEAELVRNLQLTGTAHRPLVAGIPLSDSSALLAKVSAMLAERHSGYEECADIVVDVDSLPFEAVADAVMAALSVTEKGR